MPQAPPPRRPTNSSSSIKNTAVFMDAGAIFFGVRDLHENAQLNYAALTEILAKQGFPPAGAAPGEHLRVMWTSVVAQNTGQVRFLQYAERDLGWTIRRFHPSEGYMVDAVGLGLSGDLRVANRLLRFDASIAFAIGRVATDHRIAVITDSFAIAEPLVRAARMAGPENHNIIAFFGRLLDSRWQRLIGEKNHLGVEFIDLDQYEEQLFGAPARRRETTGWNDDFLMK